MSYAGARWNFSRRSSRGISEGGIAIYRAMDDTGERWIRIPLATDLTVECLVAADINGDGLLDLVAIAGGSNLLVWFEQRR